MGRWTGPRPARPEGRGARQAGRGGTWEPPEDWTPPEISAPAIATTIVCLSRTDPPADGRAAWQARHPTPLLTETGIRGTCHGRIRLHQRPRREDRLLR